MIKIGNTIVTYDAQFRQHFEWEAVWKQANKVAHDETLFTDSHDVAVQQMLAHVLSDGLEVLAVSCENGCLTLTDETTGETVVFAHQQTQDLKQVKAWSPQAWSALLLHELAHRMMPVRLLDTPSADVLVAAPLRDEISLHADQQLELVLFTPSSQLSGQLRTVKIANNSSLPSYATVVVKTPDGRLLDMVRVHSRECLFANFVGDSVVELLPRLMVSSSHCNYLAYEGERVTLGRYMLGTGNTFTYNPANCKGLTQFCPDSEGGFVGVADGRLLPFSTLLRPEDDCDFPLADDERFMKVVMNGRMLLALTSRGHTYSNYGYSPLAGLDNVVSVGLGKDGAFYALTSEARLLHGAADWQMPSDNIYAVCTAGTNACSVRTRDGLTHFASGQTATGIGKQAISTSGVELRMGTDGSLMCKGSTLSLEHDIDDFVWVDDAWNYDKEQVVVYYGSHVECLKLG